MEMQAGIKAVPETPKTRMYGTHWQAGTWESGMETWAEAKCPTRSLRRTLSKEQPVVHEAGARQQASTLQILAQFTKWLTTLPMVLIGS